MSEAPPYEVRLRSRRVQRELAGLRGSDYERVVTALRALADGPRPAGCEKIFGNVYRVRVGNWRLIYQVDDAARTVDVGAVRRRSERTYRRPEDLFS